MLGRPEHAQLLTEAVLTPAPFANPAHAFFIES